MWTWKETYIHAALKALVLFKPAGNKRLEWRQTRACSDKWPVLYRLVDILRAFIIKCKCCCGWCLLALSSRVQKFLHLGNLQVCSEFLQNVARWKFCLFLDLIIFYQQLSWSLLSANQVPRNQVFTKDWFLKKVFHFIWDFSRHTFITTNFLSWINVNL